jgi:hypothetical protein
MKRHRQRILHHVALGQINSTEAERLWAALREERASGWMVAVAIGMASLATVHSLLAHPAAAGTLQAIYRFLGGVL